MLRYLWVRLTIGFSLIIILSTLAILITVFWLRRPMGQERAIRDNINESSFLVDQLVDYYSVVGSWEGVGNIIAPPPPKPDQEADDRGRRFQIIVADATDMIVYSTDTESIGTTLQQDQTESVVPIESDGELVGYLQVRGFGDDDFQRTLEDILQQELSRSIVSVVSIGSLIGIISGIAVSLSLTRPLRQLADSTYAIRDRRFDERVNITGSAEIAQLARAFNEMAAELERGEIQRRNLIADVAHELRTPLSVLQGNLYAILDDVYPLDKEQVLALNDQARLLSQLVNDLYELSQAEAHQLLLNRRPVVMKNFLEGVKDAFQLAADLQEITLTFIVGDELPPVKVDPERFKQVLNNLVDNALRYTPNGGHIEIGAQPYPEGVMVYVQDSGIGIAADELPHIFDRFYRTDEARSRATGGVGLGLAIVRALVVQHGGQVMASRLPNGQSGTIFKIYLPFDPQEE